LEKEKKEKEKEAEKKLKKETKQKEKEDKKTEEKNKKEAAKESKKLLKKTLKQSKDLILSITDVEEENIVVSSLSLNRQIKTINEGCIQIIKTGLNKGNPCGLVILNDCLCKRHYNLKTKVII